MKKIGAFIKKLNAADYITIYRIIFSPVALIFLYFGEREVFSWILLTCFITDALDGFIARQFNLSSDHGARLDSAGDALIFAIGVLGLIVFESHFILDHLEVLIVASIFYIAQLIYGYIRYGKPSSLHTYLAKLAAVLQGIFILHSLFFSPLEWLFWITLAASILEEVEEIICIYLLPKFTTNIKGVYWLLKNNLHKNGAKKAE